MSFQGCDLGRLSCESLAEAVSYKFTNLTAVAVVDQEVEHFLETIFKHGFLGMIKVAVGFYFRNYATAMAQLVEEANDHKMSNCSELSLSLLGFEDDTFSPVIKLVRALPLESLALSNFNVTKNELTQMSREISRVKLHELNISSCSNLGGNLSALLSDSFPSLHTLTLRECNLQSSDLYALTLASVRGKLRELKSLDISLNAARKADLFTNQCRWNELLRLNILHTFHPSEGDENLPPDCLNSIQHLGVSEQTLLLLFRSGIVWQYLQSLLYKDFHKHVLIFIALCM